MTNQAHPLTNLTLDQIVDLLNQTGQGLDWDEDQITFTLETVEDFKNGLTGMNESGQIKTDRPDALYVEGIQVRKGDQRKELSVVDLGEIRAVVTY